MENVVNKVMKVLMVVGLVLPLIWVEVVPAVLSHKCAKDTSSSEESPASSRDSLLPGKNNRGVKKVRTPPGTFPSHVITPGFNKVVEMTTCKPSYCS